MFPSSAGIAERLRKLLPFPRGPILGIDLGSSSAKIVELDARKGNAVLSTYGSIALGPYADLAEGDAGALDAEKRGGAIQDLLHAVQALSRNAGMSIPLSSTFISMMESPERDPEQMRRIIPTEAKSYIPVPLSSVRLDWQVLEDVPEHRAFDESESKRAASPRMREIMLVAVRNDALDESRATAEEAGISARFYELEMFSFARALPRRPGECCLLADLGASGTKLSIVNEHGIPIAAHLVASGGISLTRAIMSAQHARFPQAESAKHRGFDAEKNTRDIIVEAIRGICAEASHMVRDHNEHHDRRITYAVLAGGGALMPGIVEFVGGELSMDVERAAPFDSVQGPLILSDVLHDVGPLYAGAAGLALRALQR